MNARQTPAQYPEDNSGGTCLGTEESADGAGDAAGTETGGTGNGNDRRVPECGAAGKSGEMSFMSDVSVLRSCCTCEDRRATRLRRKRAAAAPRLAAWGNVGMPGSRPAYAAGSFNAVPQSGSPVAPCQPAAPPHSDAMRRMNSSTKAARSAAMRRPAAVRIMAGSFSSFTWKWSRA